MSSGLGGNTLIAVEGSRFVVIAGMIGALGGGYWMELAYKRLVSPAGTGLDLVALLIAGTLALAIAWMVYRAGWKNRAATLPGPHRRVGYYRIGAGILMCKWRTLTNSATPERRPMNRRKVHPFR